MTERPRGRGRMRRSHAAYARDIRRIARKEALREEPKQWYQNSSRVYQTVMAGKNYAGFRWAFKPYSADNAETEAFRVVYWKAHFAINIECTADNRDWGPGMIGLGYVSGSDINVTINTEAAGTTPTDIWQHALDRVRHPNFIKGRQVYPFPYMNGSSEGGYQNTWFQPAELSSKKDLTLQAFRAGFDNQDVGGIGLAVEIWSGEPSSATAAN